MEALTNFAEVTTSELETSITRLCADLNAATYRQLSMIAEFDVRYGWGDDGVRSCAHWLNWRCGISLTAAREKVRVAHALKKLPKTSLAFSSGELSYSKARAITRVGTVHNEDCLLSYARYGSASHLDKVVRLYRKLSFPMKSALLRKTKGPCITTTIVSCRVIGMNMGA